jgi:pyridoxamine 5'-phosphate oxidase
MSFPDLAAMRARYRAGGLTEADLAADPFQQFAQWFTDAVGSGLPEPNAMVVSTADADGRPSSRTVLLKGYGDDGFVFYTNYDSRKGRELSANPYTSLLFPWHPITRQVIVSGRAVRVGREETAAYFRTRPRGSQLGAWASEQSAPIASRAELERRYEDLADRYPEGATVPVPPFWGGLRVVPDRVEFWQGRDNRLHDRLVYEPTAGTGASGGWTVTRLCP